MLTSCWQELLPLTGRQTNKRNPRDTLRNGVAEEQRVARAQQPREPCLLLFLLLLFAAAGGGRWFYWRRGWRFGFGLW